MRSRWNGENNSGALRFSRLRFETYSKDLAQALLELSREQPVIFDLRKISKNDLIKELDKGDVIAGTTHRTLKWVDNQVLEIEWKTTKVTMTPISRLKDKLVQARGVAQRVATGIEAEADSLIAREDTIKAKISGAFAPHKAILDEASTELQAIEDALRLMSNDGPPLDPLDDAEPTDAGSKLNGAAHKGDAA